MIKDKVYGGFRNHNGLYTPTGHAEILDTLPSGVYSLIQDNSGNIYFKQSENTYDTLVDIPDPTYDTLVKEIKHFLLPETRQKFADLGFLYKRSSLLHGLPGTGKTSIVNRISQDILANKGIVLVNPNPETLVNALDVLKELQKHTTIMVVFEELDQLLNNYETELLNLLDGEIQKENVVYLATTNFIKQVPPRLMRPGRFSSVLEVGFPDKKAREFYLNTKVATDEAKTLAVETNGLSIDEIKEVVQSIKCFGYSASEIIKRIKKIKKLAGQDHRQGDNELYGYESDQMSYSDRQGLKL